MDNRKTKKRKKRKNNTYKSAMVLFILIFAIAIALVTIELNTVIKKKKEMGNSIYTKAETNKVSPDVKYEEVKKVNDGLSFDTFVDKTYTEDEILSLSKSEMIRVREAQIEKKENSSLSIQRILGSASSENEALRLATNTYNNTVDQTVNSSTIALEADTYYIVKVEWDYIGENTSRRYNQQVLVFKDFYYDIDKNTLNMDDINKVKDILDLKYYVETYSNVGKRPIQSFIEKNGETCEYTLYYFEVQYGEEGVSDKIYLTSEKIQIDSATGNILSTNTERIGDGVTI